MTIVLAIGFCIETAVIIWLAHKANKNENDIFKMDFQLYELRKKINGKEEAVEVLSESVRKLNGVVKDLEQKQPKIEPKNRMNTRVFIAGWDADEPEEPELLSDIEARTRMSVVDLLACQNLNPFAQQEIKDNLNCQNIYPWQPMFYYNGRYWG